MAITNHGAITLIHCNVNHSLVMQKRPAMFTTAWLSDVVVKLSVFFVGITVLRSMSLVSTPPSVSIPRVRGVTSSSSKSAVSAPPSPERMPPYLYIFIFFFVYIVNIATHTHTHTL